MARYEMKVAIASV